MRLYSLGSEPLYSLKKIQDKQVERINDRTKNKQIGPQQRRIFLHSEFAQFIILINKKNLACRELLIQFTYTRSGISTHEK